MVFGRVDTLDDDIEDEVNVLSSFSRDADNIVLGESDYFFYFVGYSLGISCGKVDFIEYGNNL